MGPWFGLQLSQIQTDQVSLYPSSSSSSSDSGGVDDVPISVTFYLHCWPGQLLLLPA